MIEPFAMSALLAVTRPDQEKAVVDGHGTQ